MQQEIRDKIQKSRMASIRENQGNVNGFAKIKIPFEDMNGILPDFRMLPTAIQFSSGYGSLVLRWPLNLDLIHENRKLMEDARWEYNFGSNKGDFRYFYYNHEDCEASIELTFSMNQQGSTCVKKEISRTTKTVEEIVYEWICPGGDKEDVFVTEHRDIEEEEPA